MSQIALRNTKRIDLKQLLQHVKQRFANTILTDTGLITLFAIVITFSVMMLTQQNSQSNDTQSVAWYTANIKAAQAKNNECHRDANASALQSTPDCLNALHAIEISFK